MKPYFNNIWTYFNISPLESVKQQILCDCKQDFKNSSSNSNRQTQKINKNKTNKNNKTPPKMQNLDLLGP